MAQHKTINSIASILLITAHLTIAAKPSPRPVFETINEQARSDDNLRLTNSQGFLPYGNPLAGSKQNARIHASNQQLQQAMFNAERMRQHQAQLQRWSKGPKIVDSYMKAYHDSQENHQLAVEEQQAYLNNPVTIDPTRQQGRPTRQRIVQKKRVVSEVAKPVQNEPPPPVNMVQKQRQELPRRGEVRFFQGSEPTKFTKADAVIKDARNRNHRSYGSGDYRQNLEPQRYKTVYVSQNPSPEERLTIKPNGNAGVNQVQVETNQPTNLHTIAIPSDTKYYAYPNNINTLKSVQDIQALNSLLKKNPTEQLTEFNALLNQNNDKTPEDITKGIPVDFYFYLKEAAQQPYSQNLDNSKYTQPQQNYASPYTPESTVKDHTPITEEVNDIEDPNQGLNPFLLQNLSPTPVPDETTTAKSNNYYKVEVASQTISTGPKHIKEEYFVKQENDPHYESLTYGYQPVYKETTDDGKSEIYLHHNAEPTGVQHLLEDGTETPAFGEDNVSIKSISINNVSKHKIGSKKSNRTKRSELETEPFLLNDEKTSTQASITSNKSNITDAPISESLIRLNPFNKKRANDFNVFIQPNFPIGEASDYVDDYDYPQTKNRPNKYQSFYDDADDYSYEDFSSSDYDFQNYPPSSSYIESKGSFSKKIRHYRRPNLGGTQLYGRPPATSYGVPIYGTPTTIFASPQTYVNPKLELPSLNTLGNTLGNIPTIIEPIYMLTQSQLKELVGHHNLNIEHLDVYQVSKENRGKKLPHFPGKYRKRTPYRHVRNNLHKLHKFHG